MQPVFPLYLQAAQKTSQYRCSGKQMVRLFLVVTVLFIACGTCCIADTAKLKITSRLEDWTFMTNRIMATGPAFKAFVLDARKEGELSFFKAGFEFPFLTVGTLSYNGLLRELTNPLGYTIGSSVFTESTRVSLDSSLEKNMRYGISVSIVPEHFTIFGTYAPEDALVQGGFLSHFWLLECIGCIMRVKLKSMDESWFFPHEPEAGGFAGIFALRWQLKPEPFGADVVLGYSRGSSVGPGVYARGSLSWKGKTEYAKLSIGYAAPDYLSVKGERNSWFLRYGGEVWWEPADDIRISGEYERKFPRLMTVPQQFLAYSDACGLQVSFDWSQFLLSFAEDAAVHQDAAGIESFLSVTDIKFEWNYALVRLLFETEIRYAEQTIQTVAYSLEGFLDTRYIDVSFLASFTQKSVPELKWKVRADFSIDQGTWFVKLAAGKPFVLSEEGMARIREQPFSYISLSLGWEGKLIIPPNRPRV